MTAIAKKLDAKMTPHGRPETAKDGKDGRKIGDGNHPELADSDALDVVRSRQVKQEVLDIIDGRKAG